MKRDEELEDRVIQVYRKAKDRIQNLHKSLELKEKEERRAQQERIIGWATLLERDNCYLYAK